MKEYTFANSDEGLESALHLTHSLRTQGFKTRLVEEHVNGFTLYTLYTLKATSAPRPNRKAQGCTLG